MLSNNLLFKKITVFLAPLFLAVLWKFWADSWQKAVIEVGILSLAIVGGAIWYLTLRPVAIAQLQTSFHRREFWRFLITPGFFIFSVFLFLLVLENPSAKTLLIVGSNLLLLLILQNLFDRFYQSSRYPANSFESISGNVNSLSLFLLVAVFYSFATFLNMAVWQLAIFLLWAATFLTYQTMWISGLKLKKFWLYLILLDLIALELFWVGLFLPNTFYVKALILTVVYYISVNLSRNHLLGLLNKKMVWRYLWVGGIILGIVLLTAQWS